MNRFRPFAIATTSIFLLVHAELGIAQTPPPADRIAQLDRETSNSLIEFCTAIDLELLRSLPPWSDDALRSALFGIPTSTEIDWLRSQGVELAAMIDAMQPAIERRLAVADRTNADGIDQAVQLSEVLLPLARARGLLATTAALAPTFDASEQSRRGFEEARRIAEQAESVSAWSDLERALIIAIASLRLDDADRAVESIRNAREALREDDALTIAAPDSVRTLKAAEALLLAIARSPLEAREVLPEETADRERLRLRFTVIAAQRATTPDTRLRILRAETDRLANEALDTALSRPFTDIRWSEPLLRCDALVRSVDSLDLGDTARAVTSIAEALTTPSSDEANRTNDLGALTPLALALELRTIADVAQAETDLNRLADLGLAFDRLASETVLGDSALEHIALLARSRIATNAASIPEEGEERDRVLDLLDILISREDASRSNIDLLAMALIAPADPGASTRTLIDRAQTVERSASESSATDADAARGLALAGATLTDALARNQAASLLDQPAISPEDENRAIALLGTLADTLSRANGDESLIITMRAIALADPAADLEALRSANSEFVPRWVNELLSTRAALLAGAQSETGDGDGAVLGAALFAARDIPDGMDIRVALPEDGRTLSEAPSALSAAILLAGRRGTYARLAIRSFSAAIHTDDLQLLRQLREAALDASSGVEYALDRNWLRVIHAEAALRLGDTAGAFGVYRDLVSTTAPEDRVTRSYWHASMRMLEILMTQNSDGTRTEAIAREIRRLRLQPSWRAHGDICERIDAIAQEIIEEK